MNGHSDQGNVDGQPERGRIKRSPFSTLVRSFSLNKKPAMPLAPADNDDLGNGIIGAFEGIVKRGSPINIGTFNALWDAFWNQHGVGIDDRKFLLEEILVFLSRLPPGAQASTRAEHFLIDYLYKDLPHPPSTFLSSVTYQPADKDTLHFAYRTADGSYNSPLLPHLGAAHMAYARSVPASHVAPPASRPDPGLLFDTLLRRNRDVPHPTGISSLFFAFANLIIHSLFRTNPQNHTINDTSSYLDLSPLYGVDKTEQNTVRRFDGSGCLWDDTFADYRLLGMPPAVPALLVIFSRNHNFIAKRIRQINERDAYDHPNMTDEDIKKQDEEIFQRARLVNCGVFMQVILRDYVGCILHMIPDLTPWHLKPLDEIRTPSHDIAPRGEGNACSIEFNLLYRWHAVTSANDAKWLYDVMKEELGGKEPDQVTDRKEFYAAVTKMIFRNGKDPKKWPIGSGLSQLKRTGPDGTGPFDDGDLARVLQNATADMAQAFRARGIPAAFKIIEIMGIEEAREWGACSLNEFRKFLGLKPYSSFSDWNPDPDISSAAERLYHDIDNLELYVGMQAEEARPSRPGSGLAAGYTMARSILADAIALIRGDRFLTIEYTPFNLTSWGFQDAETSDDNGSLGSMLPKLLLRALPNHYGPKSVYSYFPFIVPSTMQEFMKKDKKMLKQYGIDRPRPVGPIQPIMDYNVIKGIITDTANFLGPYEHFSMIGSQTFYFGGAETEWNNKVKGIVEGALFTTEMNRRHADYYYEKTLEMIADKSYYPIGSSQKVVDIVREVFNYIPLHWIISHVVDLPLQTPENLDGKYKEEELYSYLAVLFSYIYLNSEPVNAWFLELHAGRAAKVLLEDIRESDKAKNGATLQQRLRNAKFDKDEIASNILGVIINCAANWSKAMTHVIDFYLDDERRAQREAIVSSAANYSAQEEQTLIGYVQEALRLNPPVAGVLREKQGVEQIEVCGVNFRHKERVYLNLGSALKDAHLQDALVPIPTRGKVAPFSFVPGAHSSLDPDFSDRTMAQVLRAVFSKKNIRRGPSASGKLAKFMDDFHGTSQPMYIDNKGASTPWPKSLILQFDI